MYGGALLRYNGGGGVLRGAGEWDMCTYTVRQTAVISLDVLYAIHQLTITFVTYIFKITSLTFLFFRRVRKKSFLF